MYSLRLHSVFQKQPFLYSEASFSTRGNRQNLFGLVNNTLKMKKLQKSVWNFQSFFLTFAPVFVFLTELDVNIFIFFIRLI